MTDRPTPSFMPATNSNLVLGELLGCGGMAEVHSAYRTGPGGFMRKVVVKKILPHHADNPTFVERFIREATVAAQLHHPNIVEVLELGASKGNYYLVMEFIDGKNLSDINADLRASSKRIPPHFAARIVADVATALQYAHTFVDDAGVEHCIVHRDVSPDNIMVTFAGQVKLVDFGIARDIDASSITMDHQIVGKPLYMPPESFKGSQPTPTWDIYGAGAMLYLMLAGRPPFESAANMAKLVKEIVAAAPPPLSELAPDAPATLVAIAERAMAKEPKSRFAAAGAMLRDLEAYITTCGVPATPAALGAFVSELYPTAGEKHDRTVSVPKERPAESDDKTISVMKQWGAEDNSGVSLSEKTALMEEAPSAESTKAMPPSGPATVIVAHRVPSRPPGPFRLDKPNVGIWLPLVAVCGAIALAVLVAIQLINPSGAEQPVAENNDSRPAPPPSPSPRPRRVNDAGLSVICDTWGWVSVDGSLIGMCPVEAFHVTPGRHVVGVQDARHIKSRTIVVTAGKLTVVDFRAVAPIPSEIPMPLK